MASVGALQNHIQSYCQGTRMRAKTLLNQHISSTLYQQTNDVDCVSFEDWGLPSDSGCCTSIPYLHPAVAAGTGQGRTKGESVRYIAPMDQLMTVQSNVFEYLLSMYVVVGKVDWESTVDIISSQQDLQVPAHSQIPTLWGSLRNTYHEDKCDGYECIGRTFASTSTVLEACHEL